VFRLKLGQLHALVELAVINHYDWFPRSSWIITAATQTLSLCFHYNLVIDPKLAFWHSRQI
jgi:hypothetical protein